MKKHLLLFTLLLPFAIKAQQINVTPESLTGFSYIENEGPSEEGIFVVSATGLIDTIGITDTLVITASEHFEISTVSGGDFGATIRLYADEAGTVEEKTVYVRMVEGLTAESYDEDILVSSELGYAQDVTVHCSGTVIMPTLPDPVFSLEGSTYYDTQLVNITCDVEGATIKYHFGTTEEWTDFTSPILVDRDVTIWAKATKDHYYESAEVSANYVIIYTIDVNCDDERGTVSGGGTYSYNDIAILTATPNEGYVFSKWNNDSIANPMEITVTGNATFEAIFDAISFQITVVADPENGGVVSGGGTYYFPNQPTITAIANDNYAFVNWTEDNEVVSEEPEYTVLGWSSRTLIAHFILTAVPTIAGNIIAPEAICAGNSLQLTAPEVILADTEGWQISADTTFAVFSTYTDQILDETYDGWWLRYTASNVAGVSYSAPVVITVYPIVKESEIGSIVTKNCGTNHVRMLVYPNPGYQYQWYKDGQPITSADGQYFYPEESLESGTYYVEIGLERDENGNIRCPIASPEVEVNAQNKHSQGRAFPNPCLTSETLFIMRENDGDALLHIYSVDGRLMYSQMITQGQNVIQTNLAQGVYISRIIDEQGGMEVGKIIIQ